jgi:hypothetical protein
MREHASLTKLPELLKQFKKLEQKVQELEQRLAARSKE